MKKTQRLVILIFILVIGVLWLSSCGSPPPPPPTTQDYIRQAIVGHNVAYVPLNETDNRKDEILLAIKLMEEFQKQSGCQIISWNFDKESREGSSDDKYMGVCLTFFKPETKSATDVPEPDKRVSK